jgi:tetratricopeptide (TPR) repeat protein
MRPRNHALGLGLLLVFMSAPALAQTGASGTYPPCTKTVTKSDSDAAHSKYLAGKVDYDEAKYDAAIAQFREAYERDCTKHDLLIIISRAYELKGDREEAIRALEVYLERVPPDATDAGAHQSRLKNMKAALAAQPTPTPTADTTSPQPDPMPPSPPAGETRGHTVLPWLVVGAGAATMIAGVVVHSARPDSLPRECELVDGVGKCVQPPGQSNEDFEAVKERAGRWRTMPIIGTSLLIGGGVLVVGGLLWHLLEPTGSSEDQASSTKPRLRPEAAPGYGGLSFSGLF